MIKPKFLSMFIAIAIILTMCLTACGSQPAVTITPRPDSTVSGDDAGAQDSTPIGDAPITDSTDETAVLDSSAAEATEVSDSPTEIDTDITDSVESADSDATAEPAALTAPQVQPVARPIIPEGVLTHISSPSGDQVALIGLDGTVVSFVEGLSSGSRVAPCNGDGENLYTRRYFAFYAGGSERGTLYIMDGASAPRAVTDIDYLACVMGTFQFGLGGDLFGYIQYAPSASRSEFPAGTLRVFDTDSLEEVYRIDNTVSFHLGSEGVTAVSFFTDDAGKADEAAVLDWDGTAERELATLIPTDEACRFTSASLGGSVSGGMVVMVLGQRCDGTSQMQWQFYSIPFPYDGSVNLVASDTQPGDFVSFARNNTMFFPSARDVAYFTVPDGITANTVAIASVTFGDDSDIRVVVERQAIFPTFRGATNAEPRQSYDRGWMAFTMTTPNNDNSLYALDIANRDNPPIILNAGARGDVISALAFTPDSARVIYTAGSADGGDNSIFALDLASGTSARVRRGNFGRALFVAPDGTHAAANEWVSVQDGNQTRRYQALRVVDLNANTEMTLFEDTTSPANARQSAVPLAWRIAS